VTTARARVPRGRSAPIGGLALGQGEQALQHGAVEAEAADAGGEGGGGPVDDQDARFGVGERCRGPLARSSSANEVSRPDSASAMASGVAAARFLMMSASE
jgi:hypothetical protein